MSAPCRPASRLSTLNRALRRRLTAFGRARSGIAATEFALIVPIMLSMYFGMIELSQALGHGRKTTLLSRTLADLVTQSTGITNTDMNTIFSASASVLAPFETTNLAMRVTAISIDGAGTARVDWSNVRNAGTAPAYAPLGRCSNANALVPLSLRSPRSSLVISDATVRHYPAIGTVLVPSGVTMPMRPRVSQSIIREGVPTSPCPGAVP